MRMFSIVPKAGALSFVHELSSMMNLIFDPGSWLTNIFIEIPNDPEQEKEVRAYLTSYELTYMEIRR